MKSRLYVLQHGSALSKDEDAARPLSQVGRGDIERVADYLSKKDVLIQHIFHSGKLRAQQTAEIISQKVAGDVVPQEMSGISPNDSPDQFIKMVLSEKSAVLIASHMPFVSHLCSTLLIDSVDAQFDFIPGSIACLEYESEAWSLLFMVRPGVL